MTVATHHAARCFDDHVGVTAELCQLASDDRRLFRPPSILSKSYTMADAEICADSTSQAALTAAKLASAMMADIERVKQHSWTRLGDSVDYLVQRRLIGSLLHSVDQEVVLDCARGLSAEEARSAPGIVLLVPVPSTPEKPDPLAEIHSFWRGVEALPWTKAGYASLVASALLTASMKLGVPLDALAERIAAGRARACRMSARWQEMPGGPADTVTNIVDIARQLTAIIVRQAVTSSCARGDALGETARALCPTSLSAFARRFRSMAPGWALEVPSLLGDDELILVLGEAPAVVV